MKLVIRSVSNSKAIAHSKSNLSTYHYLMDTENMGQDWVRYVMPREANAVYYLFFTGNSPRIHIEYFEQLLPLKDN